MWHTCGNFFLYLRKPDNSSYVAASTTNGASKNSWHFISFIFDGPKQIGKIYVDGLDITSTSNVGISSMRPSSSNISVASPYPYYFKGWIDDIKIYDAPLHSSQIKQNYIIGLDFLLSKNLISKDEYNQRLMELAYEE